eukprot:1020719-Lingulodinium_polyedra.AAC.1
MYCPVTQSWPAAVTMRCNRRLPLRNRRRPAVVPRPGGWRRGPAPTCRRGKRAVRVAFCLCIQTAS